MKDRKATAMREKGERCDKNEKEMIQGKDSKEKERETGRSVGETAAVGCG